jgi:hypothetical protein
MIPPISKPSLKTRKLIKNIKHQYLISIKKKDKNRYALYCFDKFSYFLNSGYNIIMPWHSVARVSYDKHHHMICHLTDVSLTDTVANIEIVLDVSIRKDYDNNITDLLEKKEVAEKYIFDVIHYDTVSYLRLTSAIELIRSPSTMNANLLTILKDKIFELGLILNSVLITVMNVKDSDKEIILIIQKNNYTQSDFTFLTLTNDCAQFEVSGFICTKYNELNDYLVTPDNPKSPILWYTKNAVFIALASRSASQLIKNMSSVETDIYNNLVENVPNLMSVHLTSLVLKSTEQKDLYAGRTRNKIMIEADGTKLKIQKRERELEKD